MKKLFIVLMLLMISSVGYAQCPLKKPGCDPINIVGNNVGIGTSTPTEKFEVVGNIKSTSNYELLYDGDGTLREIKLRPNTAITNHFDNGVTTGSIEWAIDQFASGDGKVSMACGDYQIGASLEIDQDNMVLEGAGDCTRIYPDSALGVGATKAIRILAENVTVRNFQIDGYDGTDKVLTYVLYCGDSSAASHVLVEDMYIHRSYIDGIIAGEYCSYMTAQNNRLETLGDGGVDEVSCLEAEDGADNIKFINNYCNDAELCMFPHTHSGATTCGGGATPCEPLVNVEYINNTCIDGATYAMTCGGITLNNDTNATENSVTMMDNICITPAKGITAANITTDNAVINLINNTITDSSDIGIQLSVTGSTYRAKIDGNTVTGCGGRGIYLVKTEGVLINNYVSGCVEEGGFFSDPQIISSNNKFINNDTGNADDNVIIEVAQSTYVPYFHSTNDYFEDTGDYAARVDHVNGNASYTLDISFTGARFLNTQLAGTNSTGTTRYQVTGGEFNVSKIQSSDTDVTWVLNGATFTDVSADAVWLSCNYCSFINNKFNSITDAAIRLVGGESNLISGNQILNAGSSGGKEYIHIAGDSNETLITNNVMTDTASVAGDVGIDLEAATVDNSVVTGNKFIGIATTISDSGTGSTIGSVAAEVAFGTDW